MIDWLSTRIRWIVDSIREKRELTRYPEVSLAPHNVGAFQITNRIYDSQLTLEYMDGNVSVGKPKKVFFGQDDVRLVWKGKFPKQGSVLQYTIWTYLNGWVTKCRFGMEYITDTDTYTITYRLYIG